MLQSTGTYHRVSKFLEEMRALNEEEESNKIEENGTSKSQEENTKKDQSMSDSNEGEGDDEDA